MKYRDFCLIQTHVTRRDIGPYFAIIVNDAKVTVNSIYRGDDATHLLHKYGHHNQHELIAIGAPADPYNLSTHTEHNDGIAYPTHQIGTYFPEVNIWWACGIDIQTAGDEGAPQRLIRSARKHRWKLIQPYHSEPWHLNFAEMPKRPTPGTPTWVRLWRLRKTLPAS